MKNLLIALFLLISISVVAQNNPTEPLPTVGDQTIQVVNAVFDKTTEAVSELATALKVPAEHVYTVLVRQQKINAIQLIIVFILLFIISYLLIKLTYNHWKKTNLDWWEENKPNERNYYNRYDLDDNWWIWSISVGGIIAAITLCCIIGYMGDIVTGFINPEYGAIKDIMSVFN